MLKRLLKKPVKPLLTAAASQLGPHRRDAGNPRLWVLMYHRILPVNDRRYHLEEPGMRVTPESFEMHLQRVRKHFELVSLKEWVAAYERGDTLPKRACAITFDDGWRDNYEYALPLLKKYEAPATLFAVVDKLGTDFQFWPNIVASLLLGGAGRHLAAHPVLAAAVLPDARPSLEQVAAAIGRLKTHTDAELFQALEAIQWRSHLPDALPPALMDWDQLREMQNSGLVDIGSHTLTHARLTPALDAQAMREEIVASRARLEDRTQQPAELFCFPNGDYSQEALGLVADTYRAAVTTRRGINRREALAPHELTRIGLHEDVANTPARFEARLSGWL